MDDNLGDRFGLSNPLYRLSGNDTDEAPKETEAPDGGSKLVVYGTPYCGDCYRSRRFLDRHSVPYEWINIQDDPAWIEQVERINRGYRSVPTIVFPDGSTLTEPSDHQLAQKLGLNAG